MADNFNNINRDNMMNEANLSCTRICREDHSSNHMQLEKCLIANPQHCCTVILEYKTCLVPPIMEHSDVKHTAYVEAVIEKVCPGIVLICGVIQKKIKYTAISQCGREYPDFEKYDDVSFQCSVDADEANEDDLYKITGCDVVSSFGEVVNKGSHQGTCKKVFWKYKQKDIIKIAIRRCSVNGKYTP
ncbi:hypothetical protein [Oceanirhabdus seepicola]|uniref:Uncharacterized protein n=1 Tax=Oceanirhabdus seepicola TaxID=2828781 RepID=A0A9J6NYH8_9CLOT|nr:hypothetical protein [Oceanirhabdus seepicola]MCM1989323.1 hypothetical protein [Oceanirhabdus seepicola]